MIFIFGIVAGIIVVGVLFFKYYPAFGGKTSSARSQILSRSPNFSGSKFVNQIATPMVMNTKTLVSTLIDLVKGNPHGKPDWTIPVEPLSSNAFPSKEQTKITWFGHSTLLLEMDGKTIVLDPMFANTPSPFPLFGGKRYNEMLPSDIENLPPIDIVLISHDHYDHLDYHSIVKLKDKVGQFCVPLGVGSHLERWGVDATKIKEHDWWDEMQVAGLQLISAPTRHFSGRGLFNRNGTLWCSWIIIGQQSKVYFSGDSGYGPHFKEIGEKYGPFDVTLMECGQYNERWSGIHMMPEETVQAHCDVKGKVLIPIHWAAFSLALHDWTDPIERVTKAAKERNVTISTPKIGEAVILGAERPNSIWWI